MYVVCSWYFCFKFFNITGTLFINLNYFISFVECIKKSKRNLWANATLTHNFDIHNKILFTIIQVNAKILVMLKNRNDDLN